MPAFEWWWAMLLLPVPLLARLVLVATEPPGISIAVPLLNREADPRLFSGRSSTRFAGFWLWLFWVALITAASRPYWLGEPVSRFVSGRDLMLAVDIYASMSETDMIIDARIASRLDVLKVVAEKFIERRRGDRLGLILFGTNAYTYVPLTFDLDTLKKLLLDVSTGLAGRHTAIGDAIGIAIKSMREQEARHKVMILVTDGSNTAGFENPVLAAAAARLQGLTIYTVGVGSSIESLEREYGARNIPTGLVLNEQVLRQIAQITGGKYFRATRSDRLEQIYLELDKLEPVEHEYRSHRPRSELFIWPLLVALSSITLLVGSTVHRSLGDVGR